MIREPSLKHNHLTTALETLISVHHRKGRGSELTNVFFPRRRGPMGDWQNNTQIKVSWHKLVR
ncbi:hypothetical protein IHE45_14G080600 [Dioscorea alata]|uniref:Uncharacterized protein n=1 Tax=Dioscorea alata TaxID=55571 RepID=A0ACB7USV8_DIOAL|nr:hypothetical protein IHE45_14G080600 [Dioscorea alata]